MLRIKAQHIEEGSPVSQPYELGGVALLDDGYGRPEKLAQKCSISIQQGLTYALKNTVENTRSVHMELN